MVFAVFAFFSCARLLMRGQAVLARAAYSAQQLQFEHSFAWLAGRSGSFARGSCFEVRLSCVVGLRASHVNPTICTNSATSLEIAHSFSLLRLAVENGEQRGRSEPAVREFC